MSFLMIPLAFLYDEYIDRPKLSEQQKNPFEYIVPPPSGVATNIRYIYHDTRGLARNPADYLLQQAQYLTQRYFNVFQFNYI